MRLNGITILALCACAIVLILTGVLIGQSLPHRSNKNVLAITPQNTEPGAEPAIDNYQVPQWLQHAAKEWRSEQDGLRKGYAILFDHERRQLLVEHCAHSGYFDAKANRPRDAIEPVCIRVLTAQLLEFTQDGVAVMTKEGEHVDIKVVADSVDPAAKLELSFDRHHMVLVPGQTNDLMNDITSLPEMKAEYQQLFEFQQQFMRQQRAQMVDAQHDDVPRFQLPASVTDANEAVREADQTADTTR